MATGKTKKPRRFKKSVFVLLCVIAGVPLVWIADSLILCFNPASVIPDSYIVRISIPNPARLVDGILDHESLPAIAGIPALAPVKSVLNTLRGNVVLRNPLPRFAARGRLEAVITAGGTKTASGGMPPPGPFLAAWDSGFCMPLLRAAPFIARLAATPNLYYVQAGTYSRFEYRPAAGTTIFIGRRRNLVIVSDNERLFEAALRGTATRGRNSAAHDEDSALAAYDAALYIDPAFLKSLLSEQDSNTAQALRNLEFNGMARVGVSVASRKLTLHLTAAAASPVPALGRLLERRSQPPDIAERMPAGTQYATILSAGTLPELYNAATVFSGPELAENLRQVDRDSRLVLGLSIDDLLYSWTGGEFAVFGLEGRPHPVYAIRIRDERKRQEIFNRAFTTIVLNENVSLSLDGVRIPRIETPGFLRSLLRRWGFRTPTPCYTIHDDFLLASESAETLLAAVRAMQKNDSLPKTAVWRSLTGGKAEALPDSSAFSVYYSLDRSLPFFLRGNTTLSAFLGAYRQGLARLGFDRGTLTLSLSLIPGSGGGVMLMPGYPAALGGGAQNRVYGIGGKAGGRADDHRLLLVRDGAAIALNPADNSIRELEGPTQGRLWVIPAERSDGKRPDSAWVVTEQGRATLVNGDMEPQRGFPVITGLRLSAPPAASGGRLYLCDEDGKVHTVDARGAVSAWETAFSAALRSPPSFFVPVKNGRPLAAVYPKSFFGEIWLLDADGNALPNWPAQVSGIAFGSPLLFSHNSGTFAAFVTQAGELSVFDESAAPLPPFPLDLDGVFYLQPVFDGEYFWLVDAGGTLFRVGIDGAILRQRINDFQVKEEGSVILFDVNGDTIPEVFITGEGNALYGYTRDFRSLEGFPLPVWGRPLFADLNGDGRVEITGVGMDRQLYRWQFR
jgi:hypothetical protein